MSRPVTVEEAAALLRQADDILILMHQYPDGDTIGCGYALARALQSLGKRVAARCCDPIPPKYDYLTDGVEFPLFTPRFICPVDVADPKLLGSLAEPGRQADLCVDHHGTNVGYADALLLDASCGAAAMVVARLIDALGVPLDRYLAECLYTGLATDTGCFKYPSTTPEAHLLAARLLEAGVRHGMINERMFDRKSRARLELEKLALASIRYAYGGRCAVMTVTNEMVAASGATEEDMDGLAPIPRQIEGVWVGITLRQKPGGAFKVSIRTGGGVNAVAIAARFNGGGHPGAAGCEIAGTGEEAADALIAAVGEAVPGIREEI